MAKIQGDKMRLFVPAHAPDRYRAGCRESLWKENARSGKGESQAEASPRAHAPRDVILVSRRLTVLIIAPESGINGGL